MYELDKLDLKILAELDANSRQTDNQIGKKIRASKEVVNYRIKRLLNKKIINNFYTIIDNEKLGYQSNYVFLQFQKTNKDKEIDLINQLKQMQNVGWAVSCFGKWDVILLFFTKNANQFRDQLSIVKTICGECLKEYLFTTLIKAKHIAYQFLKQDKTLLNKEEKQTESILINEEDKRILQCLDQNAKMSLVDIAGKTQLATHVIQYHMKKLISKKIITGFKPKINVSSLGMQWYLVLLKCNNSSDQKINQVMRYCQNSGEIYYLTRTMGAYDLMLDVHVKNIEELKRIVQTLKENFSEAINEFENIIIFSEEKISYYAQE